MGRALIETVYEEKEMDKKLGAVGYARMGTVYGDIQSLESGACDKLVLSLHR